jgi:hypothetical protein
MLPATSNAHGNALPLLPDRDSASKVADAATIIPSTDNGVSASYAPGRGLGGCEQGLCGLPVMGGVPLWSCAAVPFRHYGTGQCRMPVCRSL